MKKVILVIIGLALAFPAWAAQTAVTPITAVQDKIGTLKTSVNTRLGTIEANRQDHETRVSAMETGKADESCFASEAAFNACFTLDWSTGGVAYTAGSNITISPENVISATGTLSGTVDWDSVTDKPTETPISASIVTNLFYGTGDCLGKNGQAVDCGGAVGDLDDLTDVVITGTPTTGHVLKYNGTNWVPAADATAEGAGYVSTPPTYSDAACTAGQYASSTSPLRLYSCLGNKWVYTDSTGLVDWTNLTPVTRTFTFTQPTNGVVTSASLPTLNCGTGHSDCTVTGIVDDTAITDITARADSGFEFTAFGGDVTGAVYNAGTVTFDANKTGSVTFSAITASYPDVLFYWGANNSLVSDKGGITGTNSGAVFDATNKAVGSHSLAKDGNYDGVSFAITSSQFARAGGQIGTWVYTSTGYVAGSANRIYNITDGAGNTINLSLNNSNSLTSYWYGNSNPAAVIGTTALATSTWYYVVLKYHPGDAGNDLTMTIYNDAGSVVQTVAEANITAMTADPTSLTFYNTGGDEVRVNADNYVISNDINRNMWEARNVEAF